MVVHNSPVNPPLQQELSEGSTGESVTEVSPELNENSPILQRVRH